MLPSFLLIGAMKSGTTTLYWYLREHPDVFMTSPKEPNFFNDHWHRGVGWYERLLAGAGAARTTSVVPDVRLRFMVRDPIAPMRSPLLQEVAGPARATTGRTGAAREPDLPQSQPLRHPARALARPLPAPAVPGRPGGADPARGRRRAAGRLADELWRLDAITGVPMVPW